MTRSHGPFPPLLKLMHLRFVATHLGIDSLARAFQYAGAQSILASLWKVGDTDVAALLPDFYRYLRTGMPKAEALRSAQIDFARSSALPFHWAGFQLIGDWR